MCTKVAQKPHSFNLFQQSAKMKITSAIYIDNSMHIDPGIQVLDAISSAHIIFSYF
jgi:hypothetical protein